MTPSAGMVTKHVLAAVTLATAVVTMGFSSGRNPAKVEPTHLGRTQWSWHPVSLLSGGSSIITFEQPDRRRRLGSLEQKLPGPEAITESAAVEIFAEDVTFEAGQGLRAERRGFGRLSGLRRASYRWYRHHSSTTAAFFATAFRLLIYDPDQGEHGSTWYLVYEPVYDGYFPSVPVDTWVRSNVESSPVWRTPVYLNGQLAPSDYCATQPTECYRYDRTPKDWEFGPNALVIGVQLTVGSGWGGSYRGFVDDVRLRFRGRDGGRHFWNFEPL